MTYTDLDIPEGAWLFDTMASINADAAGELAKQFAGGCRYVTAPFPINRPKAIKDFEPAVFLEARMALLANFERFTRADSAASGNPKPMASWEHPGAGVQETEWTFAELERIDYPRGWPCPMSIDDSMRNVTDMLRAQTYWCEEAWPLWVKDGRWWHGGYSGGQLFRQLTAWGHPLWKTAFRWQAYAWSYYRNDAGTKVALVEPGTHVFQHLGQPIIGGVRVDRNSVHRRIRPFGGDVFPAPGPGPAPIPAPQPIPTNPEESTMPAAYTIDIAGNLYAVDPGGVKPVTPAENEAGVYADLPSMTGKADQNTIDRIMVALSRGTWQWSGGETGQGTTDYAAVRSIVKDELAGALAKLTWPTPPPATIDLKAIAQAVADVLSARMAS